MARPSGIEAEEPGESPVLLGIQLLIEIQKFTSFSLFSHRVGNGRTIGFPWREQPEE
jgi:hypothetical protein